MTDVHPDQGTVPTADDAPAVTDAVEWEIRGYDPANPFAATLVFTDTDGDLFWMGLDPTTTRDLATALDRVRTAQVAAITGTLPASAATADRRAGEPAPTDVPAGAPTAATVSSSWWRQHRALAVILTLVAAIMLASFISGALRV